MIFKDFRKKSTQNLICSGFKKVETLNKQFLIFRFKTSKGENLILSETWERMTQL